MPGKSSSKAQAMRLFGSAGVYAGSVRRMLGDRRGATAVMFALGATSVLGLAGLATEGGSWYMVRRHAQNTADAAAYAGALTLGYGGNNTAINATGQQFASRNGFSAAVGATVVINHPPASGSQAGNANAVQAIITQTEPRRFAALLGPGNVSIVTAAVADIMASGNACVLTLANSLGFQGNTTVTASNCALASNATGNKSLDLSGNPTVTASSLVGSGGCFGNQCTTQDFPVKTYALPSTDPFKAVQSLQMPTFSGSHCVSSGNPQPWTAANPVAFCSTGNGANASWQLNSGQVVNLTPGTYFFYNTSIAINAGATLKCTTCTAGAGVTIILTGSPASKVGTLTINGNATVQLVAPTTNSYNAAFNGVLLYRDVTASSGNKDIQINGGANVSLSGGMYFPSSTVEINGNSTTSSLSTCSSIIASQITFTGNSKVDISGCSANQIAQVQSVVMVE